MTPTPEPAPGDGSTEDGTAEDGHDHRQIVLGTADEVAASIELAAAERAVAAHTATAAQIRGVHAAGQRRRSDERLAGWRESQSS